MVLLAEGMKVSYVKGRVNLVFNTVTGCRALTVITSGPLSTPQIFVMVTLDCCGGLRNKVYLLISVLANRMSCRSRDHTSRT